jgi:hypothetical protein
VGWQGDPPSPEAATKEAADTLAATMIAAAIATAIASVPEVPPKAATKEAADTLAATMVAAAIATAIASVMEVKPVTKVVPEVPESPCDLAVVGTRVNVDGDFCVVWKVTPTMVAVAYDQPLNWEAMPIAKFASLSFAELVCNRDTAVAGVLYESIFKQLYVSGFLFDDIHTARGDMHLYHRYQPPPEGDQFAAAPVSFPLKCGDSVTSLEPLIPVVAAKRGPPEEVPPPMHFPFMTSHKCLLEVSLSLPPWIFTTTAGTDCSSPHVKLMVGQVAIGDAYHFLGVLLGELNGKRRRWAVVEEIHTKNAFLASFNSTALSEGDLCLLYALARPAHRMHPRCTGQCRILLPPLRPSEWIGPALRRGPDRA